MPNFKEGIESSDFAGLQSALWRPPETNHNALLRIQQIVTGLKPVVQPEGGHSFSEALNEIDATVMNYKELKAYLFPDIDHMYYHYMAHVWKNALILNRESHAIIIRDEKLPIRTLCLLSMVTREALYNYIDYELWTPDRYICSMRFISYVHWYRTYVCNSFKEAMHIGSKIEILAPWQSVKIGYPIESINRGDLNE